MRVSKRFGLVSRKKRSGQRVTQVSLGPHHSAALTQKGEVYTWGQVRVSWAIRTSFEAFFSFCSPFVGGAMWLWNYNHMEPDNRSWKPDFL